MKSLITEKTSTDFGHLVQAEINGCRMVDLDIKTSALVDHGPFLIGCRVPAMTKRFADRGPLNLESTDRQLFDALSTLRCELRKIGAGWIEPEVVLGANQQIREPGRCDLMLYQRVRDKRDAAKRMIGIAEIKVTDRVPTQPSTASLLQASAYAQMASLCMRRRIWCVVICVIGLKDQKIRCFLFRNADALQKSAAAVLAN